MGAETITALTLTGLATGATIGFFSGAGSHEKVDEALHGDRVRAEIVQIYESTKAHDLYDVDISDVEITEAKDKTPVMGFVTSVQQGEKARSKYYRAGGDREAGTGGEFLWTEADITAAYVVDGKEHAINFVRAGEKQKPTEQRVVSLRNNQAAKMDVALTDNMFDKETNEATVKIFQGSRFMMGSSDQELRDQVSNKYLYDEAAEITVTKNADGTYEAHSVDTAQ